MRRSPRDSGHCSLRLAGRVPGNGSVADRRRRFPLHFAAEAGRGDRATPLHLMDKVAIGIALGFLAVRARRPVRRRGGCAFRAGAVARARARPADSPGDIAAGDAACCRWSAPGASRSTDAAASCSLAGSRRDRGCHAALRRSPCPSTCSSARSECCCSASPPSLRSERCGPKSRIAAPCCLIPRDGGLARCGTAILGCAAVAHRPGGAAGAQRSQPLSAGRLPA